MEEIICVTGPMGSGKTTICEFLGQQGFHHMRYSQLLREELALTGRPEVRENLTGLAKQLRQTKGNLYLIEKLLERATLESRTAIVIDRLEHIDEVRHMQRQPVAALILYIDAPEDLRKRRALSRQSPYEQLEEKTLQRNLGIDFELVQNFPREQGIHIIRNSGSLDELFEQVSSKVAQWRNNQGEVCVDELRVLQ